MYRRLVSTLSICLLAACSTSPFEPQDGGPSSPVDVSSVRDAQPKPVVRTRAGNPKTYRVNGKTYRVMADSRGYRQRGKASWYGTKFHGRRTSNGEVYNMYAMTAAHTTLPIPSYVRVTRLSNGKSVVVRINDRGPFKNDRLIDLSYAAAKKLGIDRAGVAWVDVVDVTPVEGQNYVDSTPVSSPAPPKPETSAVTVNPAPSVAVLQPLPPTPNQASGLYLQLGAFQLKETALSLQSQVLAMLVAPVNVVEGQDSLHRVTLGPTENKQLIFAWQRILEANGMASGFIVELNLNP